jgi:hypothetical protein
VARAYAHTGGMPAGTNRWYHVEYRELLETTEAGCLVWSLSWIDRDRRRNGTIVSFGYSVLYTVHSFRSGSWLLVM